MATDPRVLVIESNDILRVMLFTILRHQPLAVDTAVSAAEALEKTMQCDYALIVVDVDMPDQEAEMFLRTFHEERPQATTFILAVRDPKNESFLDPELVSAVITKPLEIDTVAELVRECASVVPPPEDPLPCPAAAESEVRSRLDRGPYIAN